MDDGRIAELYERIDSLENKLSDMQERVYIYSMIATSAYAQWRFQKRGGQYNLNILKPKTLNEKLIWLRENYWAWNPITYYNFDKYLFKYYTEKMYGKEHLIPLLGVWDKASDIDFSLLPDRFVLKRTLSGGSFEVKMVDKKKDDPEEMRSIASSWFSDKTRIGAPARIIAERMLEPNQDGCIYDYKIFVLNGKASFLYVLRYSGKGPRHSAYYDMEWHRIPLQDAHHPVLEVEVEKPVCFDEMVKYAEEIGQYFPLIRVDLYVEKDRFWLGELTDVSNDGINGFKPDSWDRKFGDMLQLPTFEEIHDNYDFWLEQFPELMDNPVFLRDNLANYTVYMPGKPLGSMPLPPKPFMQPMKRGQ